MTEHTPGVPLGSWLADLPDERLIRLLELRPDLAQPPPGSVAALAARAQARQSLKAASDELDFLRLAVIDALLVLQADTAPVPVAKLLTLIGDRAPKAEVLDALDDLKDRALVWGDAELRVGSDAGVGLSWHPGQVTLEDASANPDQIAKLIDGLDEPQRELLDRLLEGSPLGRTRDAAPGAPADRPVPQLLAIGLLRRLDADTVILPRHVGQVLRGEEPGPVRLAAPDPVVSTTTSADVDAAAAGAVIDLLRELDVLLEALSAAPISELRSGGLGVREVRRLAKVTGVDEARLGLILELAAAAGLIASGVPEPQPTSGEPALLGADRGRRPIRRAAHRRALASAGHHMARPRRSAGIDRESRPRRQTLCRAVGFALLDGRPARPPAAAGHAGPIADRRRRGQEHRVDGIDLAQAAMVQAAATRPGRRPVGRGTPAGPGGPRCDQHPWSRVPRR